MKKRTKKLLSHDDVVTKLSGLPAARPDRVAELRVFTRYKDALIVQRALARNGRRSIVGRNDDPASTFGETSADFDAALACFSDLPTDGDYPQLALMRNRLDVLARTFKGSLNKLVHEAEWSCLTIAMFGDTNAGKSTLIESLVSLFAPPSKVAAGQSIGTGQADYTKQNSLHPVLYKGCSFQFLDMPGIEGHESLYGGLIEEAVRKAHVLIFVNGSGKKPEQGTLQRIAAYVRDDAVLHIVVNHRSQPSAYSSPQTRLPALWPQATDAAVLLQTCEVLRAVLGPQQLGERLAVHGLLAFCAQAIDAYGQTTIADPENATSPDERSKLRSLRRKQSEFIRLFGSYSAMRDASNILSLFHLLVRHVLDHKSHILRANRRKLARVLAGAQVDLAALAKNYDEAAGRRSKDISSCLSTLKAAVNGFPKDINRSFRAELASRFQTIAQEAEAIVVQNFGDPERIKVCLQEMLRMKTGKLEPQMQQIAERRVAELQDNTRRAFEEVNLHFSRHARFEAFATRQGTPEVNTSFEAIDFSGFDWKSWLGGMTKTGLTTLLLTWEMPLVALGAIIVKGAFDALTYFWGGQAILRRRQTAAVNLQIAQVRATISLKLKQMARQIGQGVDGWAEKELYHPLVTKKNQIENLRGRLASGVDALSALQKSISDVGAKTNGI